MTMSVSTLRRSASMPSLACACDRSSHNKGATGRNGDGGAPLPYTRLRAVNDLRNALCSAPLPSHACSVHACHMASAQDIALRRPLATVSANAWRAT